MDGVTQNTHYVCIVNTCFLFGKQLTQQYQITQGFQ